ncbi:MAG: radical SAM protein [Planctomycetes bacterium]|nr:radical SAM protein [Planctomycetota bacterium]
MPSSLTELPTIDDAWIIQERGPRNPVVSSRPYAHLVEPERTAAGTVEDVLTIFITNRECPFRCLMCDLWKNTTEHRVPNGSIAQQVEWALSQHHPVKHVKLYNSGNFFDAQAIPQADWEAIVRLLRDVETVVVECHPRLIDQRCLEFADLLSGRLQVAMGLETVDPRVLPKLNKRMTLAGFERATTFLLDHGITVRAFVLLRAPFQTERQGLMWAKRSLDYAFSIGVACCAVIPTRAGNGAMDRLYELGHFAPPTIQSIEAVLDYGVRLSSGRVFMDLWDMEKFIHCADCRPQRVTRLRQMNLLQKMLPPVSCHCGASP